MTVGSVQFGSSARAAAATTACPPSQVDAAKGGDGAEGRREVAPVEVVRLQWHIAKGGGEIRQIVLRGGRGVGEVVGLPHGVGWGGVGGERWHACGRPASRWAEVAGRPVQQKHGRFAPNKEAGVCGMC